MKPRRPRPLSGEDLALWRHVTRHVRPMPGRMIPEPEEAVPPRPAEAKAKSAKMPAVAALPTPKPVKPAPPPLVPLDRRSRLDLKRGHSTIDGVLDLHGLTQAQAHERLRGFLRSCHAQGARYVLVITGKGGTTPDGFGHGEGRGVLRRMVPHWLRLPDLRPLVLSFDEAAHHHGGAGALYVRLRRKGGEA